MKNEEKVDKFELVEVPMSFAPAIKTPEGEILNTEQSIVLILNLLRELNKKI